MINNSTEKLEDYIWIIKNILYRIGRDRIIEFLKTSFQEDVDSHKGNLKFYNKTDQKNHYFKCVREYSKLLKIIQLLSKQYKICKKINKYEFR